MHSLFLESHNSLSNITKQLLIALMKKHSHTYSIATNGLEALNLYEASCTPSSFPPPKFNAILMDLSMPIMDGITSTLRIRAYEKQHKLKKVTIIALTGLASASARLEAEGAGIDVFMCKPVRFGELIGVLDSLCQREGDNEWD
jgi:CheY-like chemotaxis protein